MRYKLLKDTPFDKARAELFNYGEQYGYASHNSYLVDGKSYPVDLVENTPDWFAPIDDKPDSQPEKIEPSNIDFKSKTDWQAHFILLENKINQIIDWISNHEREE